MVEKINPIPDSVFNFVDWRFEIKQNFRTNPIQGHYDFDNNDVTMDEDGNVYLLTQIERWDFQFCTDCGDAFVDAFCEIFKFDTNGLLVKHVKLKTSKAVVSGMEFLKCADGDIVVRLNDINASNTAILTTVYRLDYDLSLEKEFTMDQFYNHLVVDENLNVIACTNVYDPNDPNIKGASDAVVTKYNKDGMFQWKSYYGGTSFDFPRGAVMTSEGGIVFLANTSSTDFDIAENYGSQDIWVVKLTEGTTGNEDLGEEKIFIFPNPTADYIHIASNTAVFKMRIVDLLGKQVLEGAASLSNTSVDVR
ncbi:MAG: T9SS type A sorting domain-containing protein, partial [Bacteroidota bacterium]|nr:T9SS type A sorting domain-containing protein [Bacteroidota bacterium]